MNFLTVLTMILAALMRLFRQRSQTMATDRIITLTPWDDKLHPTNLPTFDNVKLTAVATCPTFGIMRYEHHKVHKSNKRAMPLVAGLAAHEAFSAIRLGDLYFNGHLFYGDDIDTRFIAIHRATQLFGPDRTAAWVKMLNSGEDDE